jgi:4-hydroxybenzoyl-CoA thioesterase/acyl-CoA thioester hydrolase
MTAAFHTTRRVEFRDTDAAGIIHFSAFFHYMEEVEHEFLRSRGLSVLARDEEGVVSWPRVATSCQFRGAVRFEDVLDVELRLTRIGAKSLTYAFRFTHAGRDIADGEMTAVCCRMREGLPPSSIAIPPETLARLEPLQD